MRLVQVDLLVQYLMHMPKGLQTCPQIRLQLAVLSLQRSTQVFVCIHAVICGIGKYLSLHFMNATSFPSS